MLDRARPDRPDREPTDADPIALAEIDLLSEVMIAGSTADHRLSSAELDALLGLTGRAA